jgi:hypothetical protein
MPAVQRREPRNYDSRIEAALVAMFKTPEFIRVTQIIRNCGDDVGAANFATKRFAYRLEGFIQDVKRKG